MSKKDMENLDKTEKFDDDLISKETLHDIRDGNQTHPRIDKTEARLKVRDRIKQNKLEWEGALRATHKMGKVLHKVLSTELFQLQMGFSFPFLHANNLRSSLLNIRARSFLLSCT